MIDKARASESLTSAAQAANKLEAVTLELPEHKAQFEDLQERARDIDLEMWVLYDYVYRRDDL